MTQQLIPPVISTPSAPWMLEFIGTCDDAYEYAWAAASCDLATRALRGWKMRTVAAFFDEIGAALQFPGYFGENRAALDECLTDLSWMPAAGYLFVVANASQVLCDGTEDAFAMMVEAFAHAGAEWSTPVQLGESWDRPAKAFHVLFQVQATETDAFRNRVAETGGTMAAFETWSQAS